jgi:hypothetical protein
VNGLEDILAFEERLLDEILPALRERAHATDVQRLIDRLLLEAKEHVASLRKVTAPDVPDGDFALIAELLRVQHAKLAAYSFLALSAPGERLFRLNMEQDDYAREQAEHALAKLLAEKVTARR